MTQVRQRQVFYIPGFDPSPPRSARERYRREAGLSGQQITLSAAKGGWQVVAQIEGASVSTDVHVLAWADIVQARMRGGIAQSYAQLARTAWVYIGSGALWRLMRLRKGPVIAALYPVAVMVGQAVLAVLIWGLMAGLVRLLGDGLLPLAAGIALGGLAAWLFLSWCARRDPLFAWYLMADYAFASAQNGAYPPEQEARMADFADRIADALQNSPDEVLVVGHSSGAYIAISVLADLIRAGRVPTGGPVLSLLTLGQVVPMVSFLPGAARLRRDLALVSQSDALAWVDVTAPGDGCAFALCDPVSVSGVAGPGKRWPLVLSAAFSQTLSPARWAALRWRFLERHFQYLNAFDRLPDDPGAYCYFRVTAGPQTLAARFAGRAPSRQRIERALSPHTDQAA